MMAMMVPTRAGDVLLLMLACGFVVAVTGNFTMTTPLKGSDIECVDDCQFFVENQTIAIINITNPKLSAQGIAYYSTPIRMKDPASQKMASFSTSFTFREEPMNYSASAPPDQRRYSERGDGFTFLMSNSSTWQGAAAGRFGIFSIDPTANARVVAIEYDSWSNSDTDAGLLQAEHVGVDVATAISLNASVYPNCFAYVYDTLGITFWHRDVLYSWIEYDGATDILQVRLANTSSRPPTPLINCKYDLYNAVDEKMWVGFSGAHGNSWSVYYIYNWTFTSFGIPSQFADSGSKKWLIVGVCGGVVVAIILVVAVGVFLYLRKRRARDEPWDNEEVLEMSGMPEFISYKHLSAATKQFSDQSKLGEGGFGSVYRGVLPKTGALVAVKKVSNDSRQGEREFLAEVRIISQLRHRNIVQLMGFCRDRGKFLLVYELMPRGSLDQALFKPKADHVLSWSQRWKIVSGTAAALHYLHEGWRQQVIHRDVKSSNIMLDEDCNPKLGDFGLARLVDHEKHAATTTVAGTYGYIAPEAAGTGKFTDKTDVFAFGAVCLEVACGRKAYDGTVTDYDDLILVDLVWRRVNEGDLLNGVDPLLLDQYDVEQMYVVLKLGLLCSHPDPGSRPTMRQVEQMLAGDAEVPDVPESKPKAHMGPSSGSSASRSSGKRPVSLTSGSFGSALNPR